MSNYYQSGITPHSGIGTGVSQTTSLVSRSAVNFGGLGALVGGAAAAAQVIPKVKNKEMTSGEATRSVLKEAAGAGLATAAGAAVAGAVGLGGLLSLAAMFGVATGAKYLWNSAVDASPEPAAAKAKPAASKSKAKK
ncbi:MAG: hypothetical protein PVG60_00835 [Desulfarculaceae bacterium]|jgi:hypothetical protein